MIPQRTQKLTLAVTAVLLGCLITAFTVPGLASGATRSGGGFLIPDLPEISDVVCLTGCSTIHEVSVGGTIQITGKSMDQAHQVAFRGKENKGLRVKPRKLSPTLLIAQVPEGAASGPIRVLSASGSASGPSKQTITVSDRTFDRVARLTITDATTTPTRAFQMGLRRPTLSFVVNGSAPSLDLRVDVVNARKEVVQSRFLTGVQAGSTQKISWNGLTNSGKRSPNGAYRFVIRGNDGAAASVAKKLQRKLRKASAPTNTFTFRMFSHAFPVRGPHSFGDGLGAGRGHQGVDVLARCGQPLVAARAGVVSYNGYHSAAGNYMVIDTLGNGGKSHVYMHMPRLSPHKVGTRVKTGQRVGSVGTTGRSTACHLHFEIWSAPNRGGALIDPVPFVRAWDRYS